MTAKFYDDRLPASFWAKVQPEPNTGCWLWTGVLNRGYGRLQMSRGKMAYTQQKL